VDPALRRRFPVLLRHLLDRTPGQAARPDLALPGGQRQFYVTWLLGEASATALFLIPCISLAVLSFSGEELLPMALLTALPFAGFYLLHGHFPPAPAVYTPAQYRSLTTLNEVSVASITAALAYIFSRAREQSK
jgi:hypothetical protein